MTTPLWTIIYDGQVQQVALETSGDSMWLAAADCAALLGWQVKDNTLCREDRCLPLALHPQLVQASKVDLVALAALQQMPLAVAVQERVLSVGASADVQADVWQSMLAPDFALPDANGTIHRLSDYRGRKILLLAWASWCGCREDLPVWQALYDEYKDRGFTVITVAQDARTDDALPFIAAAKPQHPALVDNDHIVSQRYSFINVPTVVWIDESGHVVRPPRVEHGSNKYTFVHQLDCEPHWRALRHWIETGDTGLAADEVSRQMPLPTFDEQLARAEQALAWHLYQQGRVAAAAAHWDKAIALSPHDWTIRRGSMRLRDQDPFGSDFFQVWEEWEKAGKPDYISMAAERSATKPTSPHS